MQLLSVLRCAALQAIGHEEGLADALTLAARQHRQAGLVAAGMSDVSRLTRLLNNAAPPAPGPSAPIDMSVQSRLQQLPVWAQRQLRPDAPWRLEEARLLWHLGQKQAAARRAHQLAAAMLAVGGVLQGPTSNGHGVPATVSLAGGSTTAGGQVPASVTAAAAPMQLAEALSLAGHWAADAQLPDLGALGGQASVQVPGVQANGVLTGSTSTSSTGAGAGVLSLLSQAAQIVSEHAINRPGRVHAWRTSD
jgi:hypothetical protein